MKIRAIRLENVRRFVDPVCIDGITDGLNMLAEPNEYGKSTIFDALHALFFKKRTAWDREIRSLAPHVGGEPSVAVTLELGGETYRIEKQWNNRRAGKARIFATDRLHRQADDAETWISETLKSPKEGGPAGLLWVRQGVTDLGGDETHGARRDLVTSVSGEVDAMTGGRRMEAALNQCRDELGRHVTPTGRAKSGGPLKTAEDELFELERKHAELMAKSERLHEDLKRRKRLRKELDDLNDPEAEVQRKEKLEEAEERFHEAERHAEVLDRAKVAESAKQGEIERAKERLEYLGSARVELADASKADQEARVGKVSAEERKRTAEAALSDAQRTGQAARDREESANAMWSATVRAREAHLAAERRRDLVARRDKAESARREAEQALADASKEVANKDLERLEMLDEKLRNLRQRRDLEAVAVTMAYAPGRSAGVSLDGEPLPGAARVPLPERAVLEIETVGRLTIHHSHSAGDSAQLLEREAELTAVLAGIGANSLEDARASVQRRRAAEERRGEAQAHVKANAPDGIDALRAQIAALPEPPAGDEELPSTEDAERAREAAKQARTEAQAALEAATVRHNHARETAARAFAAAESAAARVTRAKEMLVGIDDPAEEMVKRRADAEQLRGELAELTRQRKALEQDAPDLEHAQTTLARVRSVVEQAETDRQQKNIELTRLDTSIELLAGEAVEEELADVATRLEATRQRRDALGFEVAVLEKLQEALTKARASARDHYMRPVLREIDPLLRLFWPQVELRFDADTVLPQALVRAGAEEDFQILSGGTQEQIALLVRLAFARMLAKKGQPAPVILDDAIVYTDDDRIERMFDALTRQAQDLQIIVFSCRQRAFRDLGGRRLVIAHARG